MLVAEIGFNEVPNTQLLCVFFRNEDLFWGT